MQTFERVFEIFRSDLEADREEEILPCRRGYVRLTWNRNSRYCVNGILCRTPEELFDVLLMDYQGYAEIQLTRGCREVTEEDETKLAALNRAYRKQWEEGNA